MDELWMVKIKRLSNRIKMIDERGWNELEWMDLIMGGNFSF